MNSYIVFAMKRRIVYSLVALALAVSCREVGYDLYQTRYGQ